ncbi:DUF4424 family protein [Roseateles sp. BYS87W]|uniref:DUF4424 family protein n=1 Tax=Pelomonas baiyunensis TaxID=3299026 RepID=A0ABW7GVM2_9BURK
MIRRHLATMLVATSLGLAVAKVEANDTLVRAVGGGIVPVKSSDIRMLKERLELSPRRVKVDYVFLNEAETPASETLAFPMPPYPAYFGISGSDTVQPLEDFATWVEGVQVASRRERRALVGDRDVTTELRTYGLSEQEIFGGAGACRYVEAPKNSFVIQCDYTAAQKRKLEALCEACSFGAGWTIQETLYWQQVFPARQPLRVTHEYAAKAGAHQLSGIRRPEVRQAIAADDELAQHACLDESLLAAAARIAMKGVDKDDDPNKHGSIDIDIRSVEYVLGTGRNWKGPIVDFELVITKERPEQLISLCFPGKAVRNGPRQISFKHRDFVPQDSLLVYFIDVGRDFSKPALAPR